MRYEVARALEDESGPLPIGSMVEAEGWRNFDKLLRLGYIRQAEPVTHCKVTREFDGHKAGTVISIEGMANASKLIEQRYLSPCDPPQRPKGPQRRKRKHAE